MELNCSFKSLCLLLLLLILILMLFLPQSSLPPPFITFSTPIISSSTFPFPLFYHSSLSVHPSPSSNPLLLVIIIQVIINIHVIIIITTIIIITIIIIIPEFDRVLTAWYFNRELFLVAREKMLGAFGF